MHTKSGWGNSEEAAHVEEQGIGIGNDDDMKKIQQT
jgi:hypothetical protein